MWKNPLNIEKIEVGDYVQNILVPEAFGIVIKKAKNGRRVTVDWDIPNLEEDTITITAITSIRLVSKPIQC
jgi:hypothetical protein